MTMPKTSIDAPATSVSTWKDDWVHHGERAGSDPGTGTRFTLRIVPILHRIGHPPEVPCDAGPSCHAVRRGCRRSEGSGSWTPGELGRFGSSEPVRERAAPRRPWTRAAAPPPAIGCPRRGRRSESPIRRRRCRCRCRSTPPRSRPRARRIPGRTSAGAQNRSGSSAEASTATCRPSVGDPGRMSTATMKARPATTRISLPCGGSHWKCSPRTTPRDERDWFTWTKRVGRPSGSKLSARMISREPAAARRGRSAAGRSGPRGWPWARA